MFHVLMADCVMNAGAALEASRQREEDLFC